MSGQVKHITLRATYESDLKGIHKDLTALKSIRKRLEKNPIRIPLALDLSGIKSQAAKAAAEYGKEMRKQMGAIRPGEGGAMSKGGVFIPASAQKEFAAFEAASGNVFKTVSKEGTKARQQFEQIERGLKRIATFNESNEKTGSQIVDTRPIENMKKAIESLESLHAGKIGTAKGNKGDVVSAMEAKRKAISEELLKHSSLSNTPEYIKANNNLNKLAAQIDEATPKQAAAANKEAQAREKAALADKARRLGKNISRIDRGFAGKIGETKGTKGDVASLLERKRNRIAKELEKFTGIADSPQFRSAQKAIATLNSQIEENRPKQATAADKAARSKASQRATANINRIDRLGERQMTANKADIDAARHIRNQKVSVDELNRALEKREQILRRTRDILGRQEQRARDRGDLDAAGKYQTAGRRIGGDIGSARLERQRFQNKVNTGNADRDLTAQLNKIQRAHKIELARLKTADQQARKIKNLSAREAELNRILERRQQLIGRTARAVGAVGRDASTAGKHSISDRAANFGATLRTQGEANFLKMGTAARNSGHDIDFHSSSLLRNAATFTKWFIPAQLVMGGFRAIGAGARNAVETQRTFKVLNAVFRGTREEAELLARQTLQLAAANGRDAQEAAEAAVSWARLGMTRTQVLMAMETSLRAANVAEISAADATKYLSAQYKAFNQTLTDIPASLDFINSLSNTLNVTPENIFQGIARTATVAKQAGVELRELASIIAIVTDVTGRPGEETGNAMKFILTRIRRPQTLDAIKDEFDLDLRKPSGDSKTMMEIFQDLAELYPKLNKLEKARINDLVAGSRQTERYAVIVDNMTEILLAHAKASFDANSAARENAEILSSVDAALQNVSTSWTEFMTAIGDMGAFDVASEGLRTMAGAASELTNVLNALNPPSGKKGTPKGRIRIENRKLLGLVQAEGQLGSLPETISGSDSVSREEIGKVISVLQQENPSEMRTGNPDGMNAVRLQLKMISQSQRDAMLAELKILLGGGDSSSSVANDASLLAKQVKDATGVAEGHNTASAALAKMSRDILQESIEPNKMLKQFDLAAELMEELPGGVKNVADARLNIRPLLENGDRQEASEALMGMSARFAGTRDTKMAEAEVLRVKNLAEMQVKVGALRGRLKELNIQMADTSGVEAQEKYKTAIATTTDRLKEAEEAAKAMNKEIALGEVAALSDREKENMAGYLADLDRVQEKVGAVIAGFGNTGFPDIDAKLRIGGTLLARDSARSLAESMAAENAAFEESKSGSISAFNTFGTEGLDPDTANRYSREIATIREEIRLRGEALSMVEDKARELEKATEFAERELELQRQADTLARAHGDAAAGAGNALAAYGIGASDGERITNRTGAALEAADRGLFDAMGAGTDDPLKAARAAGSISENLSQTKQGLLSMEQRMAQATADRANLEIEITENAVKQREEATKRLALASREDQLRAAAASAVLKNRGQDEFSMQEFQFFSQDTRGAISNFMPENVKGLDDSERENQRARLKLDREIAGIAESIKPLRDTFEETARLATSVMEGLTRDMVPKPPEGKDITDGDKGETRLNLNLGEVVMNFDLSSGFAEIQSALQTQMDNRFTSEFAKVRALIGNKTPDNSGAVSAF